jgi:hypothetical protein
MTHLTLNDLWDNATFCQKRANILPEILALKKERRLFLAPHMTCVFESKRLIWWQIQEMLRIEKGGEEQAKEELEAYLPLIPSPQLITFTLMLEYADPIERKKALALLVGIEKTFFLCFDSFRINAEPLVLDQAYTPSQKKAASVHFLAFSLTLQEKEALLTTCPHFVCTHPESLLDVPLSPSVWESLKRDSQQKE